jgi:hypothetical protein
LIKTSSTQQFTGYVVGITEGRVYEEPFRNLNSCSFDINIIPVNDFMRAVESGSSGIIYIQNLMKTDTFIQAIIMFSLCNMRGCIIGITDGRLL